MSNTKNERGGPLGGQELPPDVQDRPEQNRGYDEAVEGKSGRPGAMQVGTSGVVEQRRDAEGSDGDAGERSEPGGGQADGER